MLRIIHILDSLPNGGLERMVTSLAGALENRHHQWVCCLRDTGVQAAAVPTSVPLINLKARPNDWSLIGRLRRLMKTIRPDIVHTHNWSAWPEPTVAAAMIPAVKTVQTFHGFIEPMPLRRRLAAKVLARMTNALTAVSASLAREAARFCGVRVDRFQVIHNGVDCDHFQIGPPGKSAAPSRRRGPVTTWCASVGSLTPAKDPEVLLKAVRRLPPDIGVMWIGDGVLSRKMQRAAHKLRIADRVRWVGYRPDVKPWIQQADIIVSSSRSEALPLSLLEAMSMGKPVVATHVGGVPEVITNGYDGMTVPPENPTALAVAIRSLASDPKRRTLFGQRARQRITTSFSLETMADRYEALYDQLCRRGRRGEGARP